MEALAEELLETEEGPEHGVLFMLVESSVHLGYGASAQRLFQPLRRDAESGQPDIPVATIAAALARFSATGPADMKEILGKRLTAPRVFLLPLRTGAGFCWVTTRALMAELFSLDFGKIPGAEGMLPDLDEGEVLLAPDSQSLRVGHAQLEQFAFHGKAHTGVHQCARYIAEKVIPQSQNYLRERLVREIAFVHEKDFSKLLRCCVELYETFELDSSTQLAKRKFPQVKEAIPGETILCSAIAPRSDGEDDFDFSTFRLAQLGSDETRGRGVCSVHFWRAE